MKKYLSAAATLALLLFVACVPPVHAVPTKNGFPVIKGLYLSMGMSEASRVMKQIQKEEQKRFPGCAYIQISDGVRALSLPEPFRPLIILIFNKDRGLQNILFSTKFFNAPIESITHEEFAEGFKKAYNIPIESYTYPQPIEDMEVLYTYYSPDVKPNISWGVYINYYYNFYGFGPERVVHLCKHDSREPEMKF